MDMDISNGGLLSSEEPNLAKEMEEGNEAVKVQGKPKTWVPFRFVPFLLASCFLMSIPAMPQLREEACFETEVIRHCRREQTLGVPEPGPPGEQCKVFAKVGQDPPCCYYDKRLGFSDDVCFAEHNIDRPTDMNCRNRSRYPEVKMVGNHCTLILENVDEQDAGCYQFYMPPNTKQPLYQECLDFDDICPYSVKYSCKVRMWLIQLVCVWFGMCSVAVFLKWDQIRLSWAGNL